MKFLLFPSTSPISTYIASTCHVPCKHHLLMFLRQSFNICFSFKSVRLGCPSYYFPKVIHSKSSPLFRNFFLEFLSHVVKTVLKKNNVSLIPCLSFYQINIHNFEGFIRKFYFCGCMCCCWHSNSVLGNNISGTTIDLSFLCNPS